MDKTVALEEIGNLWLKGIRQPVAVHNVVGLRAGACGVTGELPTMAGDMWPDTQRPQAAGV
jgi:hypothetical protein